MINEYVDIHMMAYMYKHIYSAGLYNSLGAE